MTSYHVSSRPPRAQIRVAGVLGTANPRTLPYVAFPDDQPHLKVGMRSQLFKLSDIEVFVLCVLFFNWYLSFYTPRIRSERSSIGCSFISLSCRRTPLRHAMLH